MFHLAPLLPAKETLPDGTIREYKEPVYVRYEKLIGRLYDPTKKNKKAYKTLREKLFGVDFEYTAPDLYQEIAIVKELGLSYPQFLVTDIHLRAKMIAQYRLAQMLEVLRREAEIMDEADKAMREKSNAKAK